MTENERKISQMLSETIRYCYHDIPEGERALLITHLKTTHAPIIKDYVGLLDQGIPEYFIRYMLSAEIFKARVKDHFPEFDGNLNIL